MTDRELMQMALDALQKIYIAPEHEEYIRVWWPACEEAIKALRDRLAQPEPEPVKYAATKSPMIPDNMFSTNASVYTAPPKREWVGLTSDEVVKELGQIREQVTGDVFGGFYRAIEAKLKEKNK